MRFEDGLLTLLPALALTQNNVIPQNRRYSDIREGEQDWCERMGLSGQVGLRMVS